MRIVKLYLIAASTFIILDALWLGWIAKSMYQISIGDKMKSPPNWLAALAFYIIFIAGLLYFSVYPSIESGNLMKALINGSLIGLLTYSTYGLTNLATLKGWPLKMTLIDILWGAFICSATSLITTYFASYMK